MTAPRIPRHRAPIIPSFDGPYWYEVSAARVAIALAIVVAVWTIGAQFIALLERAA
jgi:hypothetical protein